MKKKVLFIAAVVICLSLAVGSTLAYYTAENTAHNVITTGNVDIALQEWADQEKTTPFTDLEDIMPGDNATKIVEVKNTGSGDAYVCVKVDKAIALAEGIQGEVNPDDITIDFNTTDWTLKDGYYYYNTALAAGEVTEPLFTTVGFAASMGNVYQECTITIDVTAYAVQAANNGTDPLTASGWPY